MHNWYGCIESPSSGSSLFSEIIGMRCGSVLDDSNKRWHPILCTSDLHIPNYFPEGRIGLVGFNGHWYILVQLKTLFHFGAGVNSHGLAIKLHWVIDLLRHQSCYFLSTPPIQCQSLHLRSLGSLGMVKSSFSRTHLLSAWSYQQVPLIQVSRDYYGRTGWVDLQGCRLQPFNGVVVEPRATGHAWFVFPRYGRGPLHLVTNDLWTTLAKQETAGRHVVGLHTPSIAMISSMLTMVLGVQLLCWRFVKNIEPQNLALRENVAI